MKSAAWLLGVALSGILAWMATVCLPAAKVPALSSAIFAATLAALVWYAWDTSRLVANQRRTAEIDQHPWLSATNLSPREMDATEVPPIGAEDIWLPIQNVGKTPAYDVEVDTECSVRSAETEQPVRYRKRASIN